MATPHLKLIAPDTFLPISDGSGHGLQLACTSLCGGVALYLLALSTFKRRNVGSFNNPRLVASAASSRSHPSLLACPPSCRLRSSR